MDALQHTGGRGTSRLDQRDRIVAIGVESLKQLGVREFRSRQLAVTILIVPAEPFRHLVAALSRRDPTSRGQRKNHQQARDDRNLETPIHRYLPNVRVGLSVNTHGGVGQEYRKVDHRTFLGAT